MALTAEQFAELIAEALNHCVSRDPTLVESDLNWEDKNVARKVSNELRKFGFDIPEIAA